MQTDIEEVNMTRIRLIAITLTLALVVGLLGGCAGGAAGPGKIAFEAQKNETVSDIDLINADGTGQKVLVEGGTGWSGTPALSPDGKRVIYSAEVDGDAELFVMDLDGKNKQQLTTMKGSDIMPAWSHDGKRIAFVSNRLYRSPLSGGNVELETGMELYVMNADGSNPQRLTANAEDVSVYPDWSPGDQIIAYMNVTDVPAITVIQVDTPSVGSRNLTADTTLSAWTPKWSPDGKYIYFMGDNQTKKDLYRMDADGKNLVNLTANFAGMCADPALSPDGKKIVFASDKDGGVNLYVLTIADKTVEPLTKGAENTFARPSWSK